MICKQLGKIFQSTVLTILDGKSNSSSVIFLKLKPLLKVSFWFHAAHCIGIGHLKLQWFILIFPLKIAINWVSTIFGPIQIGSTPMYIYIYAFMHINSKR